MRYLLSIWLLTISLSSGAQPILVKLKTGEEVSTDFIRLNNGGGYAGFARIDSEKGKRIDMDDIESIEGVDQSGRTRYFKPVETQGMLLWAERIFVSNRIEIFYTNVSGVNSTVARQPKYFQYSKDHSHLQKLRYTNLKRDVGENPDVMHQLRKGRRIGILQTALLGIGSAMVVTGAVRSVNSEGEHNPFLLIAGTALVLVPRFLQESRQVRYVNALKAYEM